jgi:hypothetical protein
LISVKSTADGNTYIVRNLPDKVAAANLLAHVRKNLMIVEYMYTKYPDDERVQFMHHNFNADAISESLPYAGYTSYSVNKGEKINFCVRQRDSTNSLVDNNTIMFVALHELAHLMTKSIGHEQEFWDNMEFLLKNIMESNLNIINYVPYHKKPQEYCGTSITDTPYRNP